MATAPHAAGLWRAVSFRADVCHGGRRADGCFTGSNGLAFSPPAPKGFASLDFPPVEAVCPMSTTDCRSLWANRYRPVL